MHRPRAEAACKSPRPGERGGWSAEVDPIRLSRPTPLCVGRHAHLLPRRTSVSLQIERLEFRDLLVFDRALLPVARHGYPAAGLAGVAGECYEPILRLS